MKLACANVVLKAVGVVVITTNQVRTLVTWTFAWLLLCSSIMQCVHSWRCVERGGMILTRHKRFYPSHHRSLSPGVLGKKCIWAFYGHYPSEFDLIYSFWIQIREDSDLGCPLQYQLTYKGISLCSKVRAKGPLAKQEKEVCKVVLYHVLICY